MTPAQALEQVLKSTPTGELHGSLRLLALLTIMAVLPALLVMMTSFTRITIVLAFVRHALGTPQIPPNPLILSLALVLTGITMAPTATKVYDRGAGPYIEGKLGMAAAVEQGIEPLREFMFRHVREKDLALFVRAISKEPARRRADVPTLALVSAFATSEIRTAFEMGFLLLASFLVVDLIVASMLMAMGMVMVPPMTISLPLKILVFVLADGWYLVVRSLVASFATP